MNNIVKFILVAGCILGIFGLILFGLGNALLPLIISFVLAYLLFPLIQRLEKRGIKRMYAVTFLFLAITSLSVGAISLIVPVLISDAELFFRELPQNSAKALDKIENLLSEFGYKVDLTRQGLSDFIHEHISNISSDAVKGFSQSIRGAFSNLLQWILTIIGFFLIPLFFFYAINDYERISEEIKSFVPEGLQPRLNRYLRECDKVMNGYVRGQFMVMAILGVLYGMGLFLVGLRFGFLIGIATGILSIVPYAGFTIGIVTALVISLANFTGFETILGIVAVFVLVQALDGFFITPRLVGNKVGLSSFATLLALIVGGNLFGLTGMLVAIPAAAILKYVLADLRREYRESLTNEGASG